MKERTFLVCCKTTDEDADLLERGHVENAIRQLFYGTAIRVIECEPAGDIKTS